MNRFPGFSGDFEPGADQVDGKNKEQVYDEQINPLMAQIIEICTGSGIAMVASFAIPTPEDADLLCTSTVPDENGESHPLKLTHRNASFAITVVGGPTK